MTTAAKIQDRPRWRNVTYFALLLLTVTMLGSSEGVRCPTRCNSCTGGIADCSQSRLSVPPQRFPANTRTINIEGNHIRVLGLRSFIHQPNIQTLKAAGNRIRRLNNDAFWGPFPNLVTLDLSRNRIRHITNRALRNMNALNTLDLSRNQIRSLRQKFHGTPNLHQLRLTRNHISHLGENDLSPLSNVHNVDLRSNRLNNIHPRAFHNLTSLRVLFLSNNPIVRMPDLVMGSQVLQIMDFTYAQLTAVPKPLPASTKDIRLNHNEVVQVNHTDFLSMTELILLLMNDNKLNFFADGALAHMDSLKEVWLRDNELVYIPRQLPDSVRNIDMKSNKIQEIETGLFRPTSMLETLSVQSNMINRIAPNSFSGLAFLHNLDMSTNHITVLEPDTFANLGSLNYLRLSNNPLARIETNAFRNLHNLTHLELSYIDAGEFELDYNFLPHMLRLRVLTFYASPYLAQSFMEKVRTAGHVTPLSYMETLDLSHTELTYLPAKLIEIFPGMREMSLDGNPLRCTQRLRWLKEYMVGPGSIMNFYTHTEPTCNSPIRLRGRLLTSILDSEWGPDNEGIPASLTAGGGASDSAAFAHGGMVNDQPPEQRMRGPRDLRQNEAKEVEETKTAEGQSRLMSEIIGKAGGVHKPKDGKNGKVGRKSSRWAKRGKNNSRKQGRNGRKGKKPGRRERKNRKNGKNRKNSGRKGRKNRKSKKNRERKSHRRVTFNTSTERKSA